MHDLFPGPIADRQMAAIREVLDTGKSISSTQMSIVQGREMWFLAQIHLLRMALALSIAHLRF